VRAPEIKSGPIGPMSWDEFLAFELAATRKHESADGFAWPWAMSSCPRAWPA
jgi:hypothetical protein